jgi:8-oxo-dGDP phosphatase
VRLYLARELTPSDGPRYEGEHEEADMPVEWVDLDAAVRLVLTGALHNPLTAMGVLAAAYARADAFATLRPADAPWPQMGSYRGSRAAAGS